MKLYISGGIHLFSRNTNRINAIENELDSVDVIFIEGREETAKLSTQIRNWIACPLILVFLYIWFFVMDLSDLFVNSDTDIVKQFTKENDVQQYKVDKPLHDIISGDWFLWGMANWGLMGVPLLLLYFASSKLMIQFSVMLLAISGICLTIAFLAGTMAERNLYMTRQISEIASTEDVEQGCLITGYLHKSGIHDYFSLFDHITVVNGTNS